MTTVPTEVISIDDSDSESESESLFLPESIFGVDVEEPDLDNVGDSDDPVSLYPLGSRSGIY